MRFCVNEDGYLIEKYIDDKGTIIDKGIVTLEHCEKMLQAVKKTQEKIGRKPNYEKSEEYDELSVIIYDGAHGFMIQDIRLSTDPFQPNPRLRAPSPEEVEKFIKHANIAYKKSTNKQIQEIQDSKNIPEIRKDSKGNIFTVKNFEIKSQKDGELNIKYEYAGDKDAATSYVKSYIEKLGKDI